MEYRRGRITEEYRPWGRSATLAGRPRLTWSSAYHEKKRTEDEFEFEDDYDNRIWPIVIVLELVLVLGLPDKRH